MIRTSVLGVGVSAVNIATATAEIARWIQQREKHYVTVTGVHGVIEAQDDDAFRAILNDSGLTVPDGMPLVWLLRRNGQDVSQVTGLDLMQSVSAVLASTGGSAFYYGGGRGVAESLANVVQSKFPGIKTAGTYCPPFRNLAAPEEDEIVGLINGSGADVVWVGLSTPKQERWMAHFRSRLDAPVLIGVGAAFDFMNGTIRRPPVFVRRMGLEWAYRTVQEPRRLWRRYASIVPRFVYLIVRDSLLGRRDGRANAGG